MAIGTSLGNPYLEGDFAPVRQEVTVLDLPVTGVLPDFLDGRYLRNGPNPVVDPDPGAYHWFLGTGMVHGLRISDGRAAWYRNRYVRSAAVARALGEPVRGGPVHAGFDFAANTHVIGHHGRTLALVEGGARPYELDDELATVGPCDFAGTLAGGYTAHPLCDPATGELHAVSYFFGWGDKVRYTVLGTDGRVRRAVDVRVGGSPMMHAFSLTERYVVVYDLPVTFDAAKVASALPGVLAGPLALLADRIVGRVAIPSRLVGAAMRGAGGRADLFPHGWNPRYRPRVGVLPRLGDSGDVRWFDVEPCYVYHPVNAYDDGDRIVLDVVRHERTFASDPHGPLEGTPTLDRWTVDLAAGKVVEEGLDDRGQEFPRIDERLVGRRHRYGYVVAVEVDRAAANVLLKHDLSAGSTRARDFGRGRELGEFVFVPSGPGAAEDDGVLMGLVYDRDTDRSDLVVLDAGTLQTVAEVHLPVRVPHGFHGSWVPA